MESTSAVKHAENDDTDLAEVDGENNSSKQCATNLKDNEEKSTSWSSLSSSSLAGVAESLEHSSVRGGRWKNSPDTDGDDSVYQTYRGQKVAGFKVKDVRMGFIRKVYSILFIQLALTTLYISLFVFVHDVRRFVLSNPSIVYVCMAIYLTLVFSLSCFPQCRRQHPTNLVVLSVITLTFGYTVGYISAHYKTESVFLVFGICTICCLAVTIFAFVTTIDFRKWGIYLFVTLICLFFLLLMLAFVRVPVVHKIVSGVGAALFMLYLIYHTQAIMGGRSYEISPDEYMLAALNLYIDILQIFMFLLGILGERS